jgi:hypothetical protein
MIDDNQKMCIPNLAIDYKFHMGGTVRIGRWMVKLIARLLATAVMGFESKHLSKIQNGRRKQRNGQHTLARQKYQTKKSFSISHE